MDTIGALWYVGGAFIMGGLFFRLTNYSESDKRIILTALAIVFGLAIWVFCIVMTVLLATGQLK